jgi:CelD/BcsL family acetyltransferase involved in cellulose biosynthesis
MNRSIQISAYDSWSSIEELIPAWESILDENPALSIFSTPEWLRSWWEAFGSGRQLAVLAFRSGNVVLGIAPLYWDASKYALFGPKELLLVGDGSGDSDNLDLIVRPGAEETCVAALIEWFGRQRSGGVFAFNTLPADSVAARTLAYYLEAEKWPLRQTTSPNAVIPLPSTWDAYLQSLSPKFRRQLARAQRSLETSYQLKVRRCESPAELPGALDTLFSLHQKRWTSAQQTGTFSSPERRDFYARVGKAFLDRGWLELSFLELDGKPVASQFTFRYRDTVYALQEGFDTDFANQHVGYALRAAMLEQSIATGVTRYDFLGGFNQPKQKWGAECGAYVNLQFAAPWSVGSCYLALDSGAANGKEWLRQHLPSPAWNVLHRMKLKVSEESRNPSNSADASLAQTATRGATESD